VELNRSRTEDLVVLVVSAVALPTPSTSADHNTKDPSVRRTLRSIKVEHLGLIKTDPYASLIGCGFSEHVPVVVWSTEPTGGEAEACDLMLCEEASDVFRDRGWRHRSIMHCCRLIALRTS
jgi:hypothetical protein